MYTPKPGDFGVVKTSGFIGRLIRIGTASRWNHAFIYVGDNQIVEANPTGVEISPVSRYSKIAWNQHDELSDEARTIIIQMAREEVGKPYAFVDIAALVLRILGLRFVSNNWLWRKLASKNSWFCSELVSGCYRKAGIALVNKKDDLVTPGDLAERLVYQ